MSFRLREHLHWCLCGGRVIFLDVAADRYFGLPFGAEAAFVRVAAGDVERGDDERLRFLVARGMLIEDPAAPGLPPPATPEAVTRDLLEESSPRPRPGDLLGAVADEMRAAWQLGRRPLLDIVKTIQGEAKQPRQPAGDTDGRLQRIASASAAVAVYRGAADRCLVRALAVHAACRRHGLHPHLVFGVQVHPFRAHCWVQRGNAVIVGDFEQVRLFSPILALG